LIAPKSGAATGADRPRELLFSSRIELEYFMIVIEWSGMFTPVPVLLEE